MKFNKMLLAILLFSVNISFAGSENPDVLLYIRDPWLMVIGSDSPVFAAYESGQLIWKEKSLPNVEGYRSVTLTKNEYAEFLSKLKKYSELNESYVLTKATDQPEEDFRFNINGIRKSVNVYGALTGSENRAKAPKLLLEVYDFLAGYRNTSSQQWFPEYIEVMVWPYEYAPEESIIWPQDWPNIESKSTRKREESYSIYVPIDKKDALYNFIASRKEKGAVEINGKKWAVSTRIPFPHELSK